MMIYITQLVYIKPGQEEVFDEFERVAIPTIEQYNGRLLLRLRPRPDSVIEASLGIPYEVHLVAFDSEKDFQRFLVDDDRARHLELKERSIDRVVLIRGMPISS